MGTTTNGEPTPDVYIDLYIEDTMAFKKAYDKAKVGKNLEMVTTRFLIKAIWDIEVNDPSTAMRDRLYSIFQCGHEPEMELVEKSIQHAVNMASDAYYQSYEYIKLGAFDEQGEKKRQRETYLEFVRSSPALKAKG